MSDVIQLYGNTPSEIDDPTPRSVRRMYRKAEYTVTYNPDTQKHDYEALVPMTLRFTGSAISSGRASAMARRAIDNALGGTDGK